MANYRVKIGSTDMGLSLAVVNIGWDAIIQYLPDTDSVSYRDEIKSDMIMNCARLPSAWGEDKPLTFADLEAESENCTVFQVVVEVECPKDSDSWEELWAGEFSSKNWKLDKDKKTITFKPVKTYDPDCIRSKWTNIYNFYTLDNITVKPYFDVYEMTQELVLDCDAPTTITDYCLESEQGLTPGTIDCEDVPLGEFIRFYHRFVKEGSCSGSTPVFPDTFNPWTLLENNCPDDPPTYWICPTGVNSIVYEFDNGRLFNDALEYMLEETGCGFTLVSDFFNINPDSTAPSNAAYTAAAEDLHHLVIYQKSDIKRHSASDPATAPAWDVKLRDVLNDLRLMFNVRWRAKDGVFRLEHVSYFESQAGNDYTTAKYERTLEENTLEVANITKFKYRDARATDYFKGHPIEIYCGTGEEEKQLTLFYTDLTFTFTTDGLEAVGDDGFFLMSTYLDGPTYRVKEMNRPLAWTELHYNYHRHDMPGAGKINNSEVTPLSIRKTRKAPRFSVTHCCDDTFDPADYITTSMGEGDVVNAEWNITRDYLSPELKY
jgi:hypothetical protein